MGTLDSREYERLVRRKFRPYSKGHRRMYEIPVLGEMAGKQHRVAEAGFGIGWGLDLMLKHNVLEYYEGFEPNRDSYRYVADRVMTEPFPKPDGIVLHNRPFGLGGPTMPWMSREPNFDYAFCIEVIEHVPMDKHMEFLRGLRALAPTLWFSTPDKTTQPKEGVRTKAEWEAMLREAGFDDVKVDTSNWTYLYACR